MLHPVQVAFEAPRYHAVEAVAGSKSRYSLFGWFLEEGILYDLYSGDDDDHANVNDADDGANGL